MSPDEVSSYVCCCEQASAGACAPTLMCRDEQQQQLAGIVASHLSDSVVRRRCRGEFKGAGIDNSMERKIVDEGTSGSPPPPPPPFSRRGGREAVLMIPSCISGWLDIRQWPPWDGKEPHLLQGVASLPGMGCNIRPTGQAPSFMGELHVP